MARYLILFLMLGVGSALAKDPSFQSLVLADDQEADRYIAQIQAHSKSEIETLMDRAEAVVTKVLAGEKVEPIQFVLHGEEVRLFFRSNYSDNKMLIDRAARLDAFNVVDIKICETWMHIHEEPLSELYPFIETVPLGPREEKRLVDQGYIYF
ncbi:MAG: hypothetical protein MI867_05505 [Pseudomonadales bacterium]|nr:hypothetical protein [Pseudomonadales bacterium]